MTAHCHPNPTTLTPRRRALPSAALPLVSRPLDIFPPSYDPFSHDDDVPPGELTYNIPIGWRRNFGANRSAGSPGVEVEVRAQVIDASKGS